MSSALKPPQTGFRSETGNSRGRAHRDEDKAKVRRAFVEAGRHLMATDDDPSKVSLRRIAALAGYSPGSIYQYFRDHQALLFAIREVDMNAATDRFEEIARRTRDPVERVRKLFLGTVEYWLEHLDQFDVLFSRQPNRPPLLNQEGVPFGESPTVLRSLQVYYDAVEALFAALPSPPMKVRVAADTLIAVTHGIVAFPRHTRTMRWSDTRAMAQAAVDGLLSGWFGQTPTPPRPRRRQASP